RRVRHVRPTCSCPRAGVGGRTRRHRDTVGDRRGGRQFRRRARRTREPDPRVGGGPRRGPRGVRGGPGGGRGGLRRRRCGCRRSRPRTGSYAVGGRPMGIELPAELAEIARVTGVSWPEADEDALRTQAQGWRRAAQELTALARDADVCVTRVFEALSGPAAEAAQARWSTLGDADTGLLAEAIKGATEAADRLDHAAEQVGRAKVEIVRQLVEAAQTRDATLVAADTGHPTALLGLETVLRDAAVNLGNVTSELIDAVGADPASTPDLEGRPGPVDAAGIDGVEAAPAGESADETGTVHGAASASAEHVDGAAESDEPDEESGTEDTGPISLARAPTPPTGQRFPQFIASEAPTPSSGTAFASGPVAPPPSGQQQVGPPVPGVPGPVAAEPWVRPGQTHL